MRLSQEAIRRMISGRSGGGAGGGGSFDPSALAGYATQAWTEENYISKTFFNELFVIHKKVTTVVMDGETEISRTVTTNSIFAPNEIPDTTTETDEETGYVTTVTTEVASIESKKGFWTNYFLSALGLNSEGGGGGLTLNEPLATINVSGLADHPSSSGQTIVWNGTAWVYGTAGGGTGTVTGVKVGDITYSPVNGIVSLPAYPSTMAWSAITGKPTTIAGYGITDAKIENGVITLGSNTITPLTSSAITDMATKTWVGQQGFALASNVYSKTDADSKFMTIAAFENLFNALNSSDQKVSHPYSSGVASIKAMVGLWTEQYLSALGKSDSGGEVVLNEPLASINDAGLASHPSSSGQTIVWNGSAWTYGTAGGSGMTYTFATGDANGQFKVTPSSGAAYNVSIKGLAALAYKASLAVSDIPDLSGRYLPLTGGTITGNIGNRSPHDLSATNNGVESGAIWRGYYIYDKDSRLSAQFVNGVYSSGSNFVWMGVRNYNTEGTQVADYGIGLSVDKSGNASYTVSQPAAFRTAIDALSKTEINAYTWWGRALSNGVVNGDMTNVGNISFSASGKNIGGLMSFVTAGNGTVGVGTLSPNTNYKLDVNGYTKTSRLYLSDTIYMVVQNDGIHIVGGGLYADTYVSALGLSDSGGSGGIDWDALAANTNEQINVSHLTTALAPYALTSQIPTSLKNPYKLTITLNGTATEYDGSEARSLTINTGLDQQALTTYLSSKILTVKNGTATLGTWNPTAAGVIDIASAVSGYLPLTGGSLTGNLNIVYSHDLSKTNNGVSDTLWPGYRIYDKDGRRSAQFVNGVYSNGNNFVWMSVSNYDTSGNMIADYGIGLSVDKNGAGTWSVSEPAAFRTAIGITSLLNGYLPLTGGILSGQLSFSYSNSEKLILYANNEGGNIRIVSPSSYTDEDGNQRFWEMDAYNGNLRFYSRNNGTTWVNFRTDGSVYSSAQGKLWGEDNDGSGSGLDADTLDGLHASQLQTAIQYSAGGTGGSVGWIKVARITIGGAWTNQSLIFKVTQRGRNGATLTLRFTNVGTISDVRVDNFTYNGDMDTATIVNVTSGSVWDLYIRKTEAYDSIGISQIDKGANIASINVTWTNEQAASVPTGVNDGANDRTAMYDNPASGLKTAVNIWGNAFDGTADINGNLVMPNNGAIVIKDTNGVGQNVFTYNSGNDVVIGWDVRSTSDTYITGNTISIARNGGTSAIYVNTSNNVGIGGTAGDSTYKLTVAGAAKVNELWIGNIRITASAEGIHIANGGLSANTYVSALGIGDQGGGGGADLETVWASMAENDSSHYIHISHIQSALSSYLSSNNYITSSSITDMATKTWVGQQGYITSSALTGYATQQWVKNQGYVTNAGVMSVGMSVPTGLRVNSAASATITGTGTFALTFTSGYSIPTTAKQSNWDTAYGWGNHASAGYATPNSVATQMQSYAYISGNVIHIGDSSITPLTSHQSVDGTFWGHSWSNHGTVNGDMSSVGNISFSASGNNIGGLLYFDTSTPQLKVNTSSTGSYTHGYSTIYPKLYVSGELGVSGGLWAGFNELYYSTPYIDFHYDYSQADYTTRLIESEAGILSILSPNIAGLMVGGYNGDYVQIGQIRIVYESSNNALRIENANNGGAANLYAMGGISALGMSGNADGTISGNLTPSSSDTYTLGSSSARWKALYLGYSSSRTLEIKPTSYDISFNSSGSTQFTFNNDMEVSGDLYVNDHLGVGDTPDSENALFVNGTSYMSDKLSINGTNSNSDKLYVNGTVRASSYNNSSDARLKNIISNENINIETIARAPIVRFTWKNTDDSRVHWGTLAQYWRSTEIGDIVEDGEYLAMDYAATALAGVISVARKVMTHEERIAALEKENERLRNEIETLKAA